MTTTNHEELPALLTVAEIDALALNPIYEDWPQRTIVSLLRMAHVAAVLASAEAGRVERRPGGAHGQDWMADLSVPTVVREGSSTHYTTRWLTARGPDPISAIESAEEASRG